MYSTQLAVTSKYISLALSLMLLQLATYKWHTGSQQDFLLTVHLVKNLHDWVVSDSSDEGRLLAFQQQYVKGHTLDICLTIHTRLSAVLGCCWGGLQTLVPCHTELSTVSLLPPRQLSDMQACLYLLWFHYPGCLFWHLNVSVAY